MIELQRLYPIADSACDLPVLDQVRQMAAAGASLIQIRDKHADGRALFEAVAAALVICRSAGARLIVNDRVDVAVAAGADGVHVGQQDLPVDRIRSIVGPGMIVGFSTHSALQAAEAALHDVDYIAIGPVFPTRSKADPDPPIGLEGVADARRAAGTRPLVAIGGIELSVAPSIIAAGAASVAVIGDLRSGASIESRVRQYLEAL